MRILAPQQRRREVELEAQLAFKRGCHLPRKRAVGVEPRHLILILVGHQLEGVARHSFAQPALARRAALFHLSHAGDKRAVLFPISCVLVGGEKGDAARHHLVQRHRQHAVFRWLQRGCNKPRHRLRVCRRAAAPVEGGEIHAHRLAIEFYRTRQ